MDPVDPSLKFIEEKDNLRPLAILGVDDDFLLCYDGQYPVFNCLQELTSLKEWAVLVDKHGSRARGDWRVNWEGRPIAFGMYVNIPDLFTLNVLGNQLSIIPM